MRNQIGKKLIATIDDSIEIGGNHEFGEGDPLVLNRKQVNARRNIKLELTLAFSSNCPSRLQ
jgi:hypothetical protein